MKISLVIPVYNEQIELTEVLAKYITDLKSIGAPYEIIMINDGSSDQSLQVLTDAARLNRNIRIINFDARYGKQAAITAGMDAAEGDCVILADVDILNPIGILKKVYEEFIEGEDIVHAYRERSGWDKLSDTISQKFVNLASSIFGVAGHYVGRPRVVLYSRDVADIIKELPAKNKLMRTMDNWVDYKIKKIMYVSGYNKNEENIKNKEAKAQFKRRGGDVVQRSKVREHTSSLIYARAFFAITAILFVAAFVLFAITNVQFIYHFFLWVVILLFGLVSLTFYARAVLIKRVGIIHDRENMEIYNIESTIN